MTSRLAEDLNRIVYHATAFSRQDEQDDALFYDTDRFVEHLDSAALEQVRDVIASLVVERSPTILDLMASWDSHLPTKLVPKRVVGIGMNQRELASNEALDEFEVHDLNRQPSLPFADATFDVVLNTVSVDYLTKPFEVFDEVQRVLKPGGMHLVIFSNRMFPDKAVRIWREANEEERTLIVEDYFAATRGFGPTQRFVSKGRPRSPEDKYADITRVSDPVYAVWAEKVGGSRRKPRPVPKPRLAAMPSAAEIEERKSKTRETLCCPYCDQRMRRWQVPLSPFSTWDTEFLYLCMNDECPYVQRGWDAMARQGNASASYRAAYDPGRNTFMPLPIPSLRALFDGLVEEDPENTQDKT